MEEGGENLPDTPPPEYDTIISLPDYEDVPAAPEYDPPKVQGITGDDFSENSCRAQESSPQLVFADFLPRLISPGDHANNILPTFDNFKSVVIILNDWLKANPRYHVIRAESIDRKVDPKSSMVETESTMYHESAFGIMQYVRGIRVWLVPNTQNLPAQQLWYLNVVPKSKMISYSTTMMTSMGFHLHARGRLFNFFPQFEDLDSMVKKLNEKLQKDPLPGSILTIESVDMKYVDFCDPSKFDPDAGFFFENQSNIKLYLTTLRVFFVMGPAKNQQIAIQDFAPAMSRGNSVVVKPKFEPFTHVINKASAWIKQQQGIKITNMQAVSCRADVNIFSREGYSLNTNKTDFFAGMYEAIFVKVLRIAYVTHIDKGDPPPEKICLYSRAFVPIRTGRKSSETMSQTLERVNNWLMCTGARVIGVDSLDYEVSPESKAPVDTDRTRHIFVGRHGHYWITSLRLYINGPVEEPPEEVFPPIPAFSKNQNVESSSCCNIL